MSNERHPSHSIHLILSHMLNVEFIPPCIYVTHIISNRSSNTPNGWRPSASHQKAKQWPTVHTTPKCSRSWPSSACSTRPRAARCSIVHKCPSHPRIMWHRGSLRSSSQNRYGSLTSLLSFHSGLLKHAAYVQGRPGAR